MKSTLQILKEARELLSDEKRWTRGAGARDANGVVTDILGSDAQCWCAAGALRKVVGRCPDVDDNDNEFIGAREALRRQQKNEFVSMFNDRSSHAEVVALFDAAIAAEERS